MTPAPTLESSLSFYGLAVLGLPLLSFITSFLIPRRFSWLTPVVSSLLSLLCCVFSFLAFFSSHGPNFSISLPWFSVAGKMIVIGFSIDSPMIVVSSFISLLIHIYSIGYMADDRAPWRFFGVLGLFTFSMLGLVMSTNLLVTFCFWELIGFSSYRLIGHYHDQTSAGIAAFKASLMNKVGDVCFIIFLMIVWANLESFEALSLQYLSGDSKVTAAVFLFIAVMAKSAQFPLFTWLPDAMEGPTPVSALLHSATMVAAGVFLLLQFSVIFFAPNFVLLVSIIGAITAITGALAALFQYDIKKILAYSTISQLGLMVMSSMGRLSYGHLINHAFFKAGLFLCAGAIIHALSHAHEAKDVNDIRNMGNLRKAMPYTFWCFMVCAASLSGLPLTSGFVSKELILTHPANWIVSIAAWCATFLTPLYVFRLAWYVFFGSAKSTVLQQHGITAVEIETSKIQEAPWIMRFPMLLLTFASFSVFSWNSNSFVGLSNLLLDMPGSLSTSVALFSLLLISGAFVLGYFLYRKKPREAYPEFLVNNFLLDKLFQRGINKPVLTLAQASGKIDIHWIDRTLHRIVYAQVAFSHLVSWGDRVVIDGLVALTARTAKGIGSAARSFTNGKIQSYITWAMLSLIIFIIYILFYQPS